MDGFLVGNPIRLSFGSSQKFKRNAVVPVQAYFAGGDLAVLMLEKPAKQLFKAPKLKEAPVSTDGTADVYVGKFLTACGFGDIDNEGTKPKILQCTTLLVVPQAQCTAKLSKEQAFLMSLFPSFICLSNEDDSNSCGSDNGGALYTSDGTAVGIIAFQIGTRPNAGCVDGHMVLATQLGSYADALKNPLTLPKIPNFPVS